MAGPLVTVDTLVAGVNLDVGRLLYMGQGAALEFYVPDETAHDEPIGMRLVRRYENSFNRMVEEEAERGDGQSIIFQIADTGFPEGQVAGDLAQKDLYLVYYTEEGPFGFYKVDDVPKIAPVRGQVYVITAKTRTFKRAYFGRS